MEALKIKIPIIDSEQYINSEITRIKSILVSLENPSVRRTVTQEEHRKLVLKTTIIFRNLLRTRHNHFSA